MVGVAATAANSASAIVAQRQAIWRWLLVVTIPFPLTFGNNNVGLLVQCTGSGAVS